MNTDEVLTSVIDAGFVAKIDGGKVVVDLDASKTSSGGSDISEGLANLKSWCAGNGLSGSESGNLFTIA